MDIKSYNISSTGIPVQKSSYKKRKEVSFGEAIPAPLYKVTNSNFAKKLIPRLAFGGSIATFVGYFVGSAGLFYDIYKENGNSVKAIFQRKSRIVKAGEKSEDGVKTITTSTKFGKIGMTFAKVGIAASSLAGIACGIGEGMPTMALGEMTNVGAAPIIETPIGTGLFGIGIASIFSGLALENTPDLKLNQFRLMAAEGSLSKAKMVGKNMGVVLKEISSSIFEIAQKSYKLSFWKENFFHLNPKTVVLREMVNKDGKVTVEKMLRHNKNYIMHAASFTLGLGGIGIIASSILNKKKAQKASLRAEEGGFLFDNLGITRYGLDKYTTGSKSSGKSFAIGGVINAISQFMGIDNKDGRAAQWFGISLVFLGYAIDRGHHLKNELEKAIKRTELTDVVREWKIDLSKIVDKKELGALLKEIKKIQFSGDNSTLTTNKKFNDIEIAFKEAVGGKFQPKQVIENALEKYVGKVSNDKEGPFQVKDIAEVEETKRVLKVCTKKIFGNEEPKPISLIAKT